MGLTFAVYLQCGCGGSQVDVPVQRVHSRRRQPSDVASSVVETTAMVQIDPGSDDNMQALAKTFAVVALAMVWKFLWGMAVGGEEELIVQPMTGVRMLEKTCFSLGQNHDGSAVGIIDLVGGVVGLFSSPMCSREP